MKSRGFLIVACLIFLSAYVNAYSAPPSPPMIYHGNISTDGVPYQELVNMSVYDNETLIEEDIYNSNGRFLFVLRGVDNLLTYNDDPNCLLNSPCVPCNPGYGETYCIEGIGFGANLILKVDSTEDEVMFSHEYPNSAIYYDGLPDNDNDGYLSDVDCNDSNPLVYPGAMEICNGMDDNCLGGIDEDIDDTYNGTDVGICEFEVQSCIGGEFVIVQNGILPIDEICDLLDNDCDGDIDNNLSDILNGTDVGTCQIEIQSCVSGDWEITQWGIYPADEYCDGLDTDCDGILDASEGFGPLPCGEENCSGINFCENEGYGNCTSQGNNCGQLECDDLDTVCGDYNDIEWTCDFEGTCIDHRFGFDTCDDIVADSGVTVCDSNDIYECQPGVFTLGADLFTKTVLTYCGENTGECDGIVDDFTNPWDLFLECGSFEYCSDSTLECTDSGFECVIDDNCPGSTTDTTYCDGFDVVRNVTQPNCNNDNMCEIEEIISVEETCDSLCQEGACVDYMEIDSCMKLNISGMEYRLTADIESDNVTANCLKIAATDVTLDCQSHYIESNLQAPVIRIKRDYAIIKNCELFGPIDGNYDSSSGILMRGEGHLIIDNEISGFGMGLDVRSFGTTIADNYLEDNIKGIHLMDGGDNNIVKNNLVKNHIRQQAWGLAVWRGAGNTFENNKVYGNRYGIILNYAHDITLDCNLVYDNSRNELYIYSGDSTNITSIGTNYSDEYIGVPLEYNETYSDCSGMDCEWNGDECL